MFGEFKAFINRGNVLDLAVAVIIGAAFGKIVTSLTDDIIMPIVGKLTGGLDFSGYFARLGPIPADFKGSLASYADLKKAGVPLLGYGQFLTQFVDFLIVAFIVFLIVRAMNRAIPRAPIIVVTPAEAADIVLLREIRDALRGRGETGSRPLPLDGQ